MNDFLGFEVCSTAFFTLEYLARLWSTSVEPKYRGWRGRLRWARQPLQVIDLICLFAFYIDVLDIEKLAPQHWKLSVSLAAFKIRTCSNHQGFVAEHVSLKHAFVLGVPLSRERYTFGCCVYCVF